MRKGWRSVGMKSEDDFHTKLVKQIPNRQQSPPTEIRQKAGFPAAC
jgi:hypothetical protein